MPRMNPKELERWRKELHFANEVWKERGYAKEAGDSERLEGDLWDHLRAYRGEQWERTYMNGVSQIDEITTPLFFSVKNTFEAQLLARTPKAQVLPRKKETARSAAKVEALLNYDIYELKMKRQWNRVLNDAFFAPAGILRHGYTPSGEKFDKDGNLIEAYHSAKPDKPWVRRVKFWDFRMDPLAEAMDSDGDARWCAFRSLMTMDQIKATDDMIARDDLKPTVKVDPAMVLGLERTSGMKSPTMLDAVEIWTVYDKEEEKWFQLAEGCEKPVRDPDDWPIPWDGLPFDSLYFNESMDDFFPEPYARTVLPTCIERNRVRTVMQTLVKSMRRLLFVNKDRLAEGQAQLLEDSALVEALMTDGSVADVMSQAQVGGLDSSLIALDQLLVSDVREAMGQSSMDRGQRINVETAQEAAGVQQGASIHLARNQEALESFLSGSMRKYMQARRVTMFEDELVPILGRNDASSVMDDPDGSLLRVGPDDLRNEYDYIVRAGSSLPASRQSEVQSVLADFQVFMQGIQVFGDRVNWNALLERYAEARGIDPNRMFMPPEAGPSQAPPGSQEGQVLSEGADGDIGNLVSLLGGGGGGGEGPA